MGLSPATFSDTCARVYMGGTMSKINASNRYELYRRLIVVEFRRGKKYKIK